MENPVSIEVLHLAKANHTHWIERNIHLSLTCSNYQIQSWVEMFSALRMVSKSGSKSCWYFVSGSGLLWNFRPIHPSTSAWYCLQAWHTGPKKSNIIDSWENLRNPQRTLPLTSWPRWEISHWNCFFLHPELSNSVLVRHQNMRRGTEIPPCYLRYHLL